MISRIHAGATMFLFVGPYVILTSEHCAQCFIVRRTFTSQVIGNDQHQSNAYDNDERGTGTYPAQSVTS